MFANKGASPLERISALTESASRLAGASCEAITAELARLIALELTEEEFGDLMPDAVLALDATLHALCELREAACVREARS